MDSRFIGPTVEERGIDESPEGATFARAFIEWGRQDQWITPGAPFQMGVTYGNWEWPISRIQDYPNAKPTRVWPSVEHWWSPGLYNQPPDKWHKEPMVIRYDWNIPRGGAPAGVDADYGQIILYEDLLDRKTGVQILGMRRPNELEKWGLRILTSTNAKENRFRDGDLVADAMYIMTAGDSLWNTRGAGRVWKYRGLVRKEELDQGRIDHPLSIAAYNIQYGAGATFRLPANRVEKPNHKSNPCGKGPKMPVGDDDRMIPHGFAWFVPMSNKELLELPLLYGLEGDTLRTARIIGRALSEYGAETLETSCVNPQIQMGMKTIPGITDARTANTLLNWVPWHRIQALNPAAPPK